MKNKQILQIGEKNLHVGHNSGVIIVEGEKKRTRLLYPIVEVEPKQRVKVSYSFNARNQKGLWLQVSDYLQRVSISLDYVPTAKDWRKKSCELAIDDPYWATCESLKRFVVERLEVLSRENPLSCLQVIKSEIESMTAKGGIEEIARRMFNDENLHKKVPEYDKFIEAFEHYSKLPKGKYKAMAIDEIFYFYTNDKIYIMTTYQSQIAMLKDFIDRRSYDEIYTQTNESVWSEIYVDGGIELHEFIPAMLRELENYWESKFRNAAKFGYHLDVLEKEEKESFRKFDYYTKTYNQAVDAIKLAWDFDEMVLYPVAVITMMKIFNADVCYDEYCELEFDADICGWGWESICLNKDEEDGLYFYIRPHEE